MSKGGVMEILMHKATDAELVRRIESAVQSIALYAPGVSGVVADALCDASRRINGKVKVVLDLSPKSIELGYLEKEAIRILWREFPTSAADCSFFHLPGLRLSTLHVDDQAFVYAPIARKIEEANSEACESCPNGIELKPGEILSFGAFEVSAETPVTAEMIAQFCSDLETMDDRSISERIAAAAAEARTDAEKEIKELKGEVEKAKKEAETAVADYKNRIKIRKVEYAVKSSPLKIGDHRVKIPPMFLVGVDDDMEKKLQASYRIFPSDEELAAYLRSNASLSIEDDFKTNDANARKLLITVRKFGHYVRTDDLEEFEKRVKVLQEKCNKFGEATRKFLRERKTESQRKLFDILMRQWRVSGDPWWKSVLKREPDGEDELFRIFQEEMDDSAKGVEAVINKFRPSVEEHVYMLDDRMAGDEEFRSALYKALREKRKDNPDWPLLRPDELLGPVTDSECNREPGHDRTANVDASLMVDGAHSGICVGEVMA